MMRRVNWQKGMRLTDELLRLSDKCTSQQIGNALVLAAAGRFGLVTSARPFRISVECNSSFVDVVNLSCFAVTPNGTIIDVEFDSNYSLGFNSRVPIHQCDTTKKYLLLVGLSDEEWNSSNDALCEPVYKFSVIEENSRLQPSYVPVARLICDGGVWHIDEVDFVPPCLYVTSHDRFIDLAIQFQEILRGTEQLLLQQMRTPSGIALQIMWPQIQQLMITMDRCCDLMTPMALYGNVQKYVGAFVCASSLDECMDIDTPEIYQQYVHNPYNYRDVYARIREGMIISAKIRTYVENFVPQAATPKPAEKPSVPSPEVEPSELHQIVKRNVVGVSVKKLPAGGVLYYSINGGPEACANSNRVQLNPRFAPNNSVEPAKTYDLKLRFEVNGIASETVTYQLIIEKDHFKWIII